MISKKRSLTARISNLAQMSKARVSYPNSKRSILITTQDRTFETHTYSFDDMKAIITKQSFYPGYLQNSVKTISALILPLEKEASNKFKSLFNYASYYLFKSLRGDKDIIILPLDEDIFNQHDLNTLLTAINNLTGSKITISFNDTFLINMQVPESVHSNVTNSFFNTSQTLKHYKNRQNQLNSLKKQNHMKQISEGLYTVKRFNRDAEASEEATLKNDCSIKTPQKLTGPFSLGQVTTYSEQLDVAILSAKGLGIKDKYLKQLSGGQNTSQPFKCILNHKSDAVIYINKNMLSKYFGKLTYKSMAKNERFTIGELYARILSNNEHVNKPTLMILQLKLLDEIGLLEMGDFEIEVPKGLTPKQLLVFHGFKQLMRIKQSVVGQEDEPILFTYSFASLWCSVSRITATAAIKKFVEKGILYIADQIDQMAQYLFCKAKSIKESAEQAFEQTKAVKTVIQNKIKNNYLENKGLAAINRMIPIERYVDKKNKKPKSVNDLLNRIALYKVNRGSGEV